jgi:putative endopeptidase
MTACTLPRLALLAALAACATTPAPKPPAAGEPPPQLPYTPSLDVTAMDRTADACSDLFQFACGRWSEHNPLPADQTSWSAYAKMQDDNRALLRALLEKAGRGGEARAGSEQKIGDYYAACMDEARIDALGAAPLQPLLTAIDKIGSLDELARVVAHSHRTVVARGSVLFGAGSEQDAKDSQETILAVDQAGLGLPDRDYYLKDEPRQKGLREKYQAHVARVLQLLGDGPEVAAAGAKTVLQLETQLAQGQMSRVERREPKNVYHRMPVAQLERLAPDFPWRRYFALLGAPAVQELNVASPGYFEKLGQLFQTVPLADWKTYLRWNAARFAAPYLGRPFADADFDFYSRTLLGAKEQQPRWKRCVGRVDRHLGEALGEVYVKLYFTEELRARTLKMVQQIEKAMEDDLRSLSWMSAATKAQALEKLRGVTNKIGHRDKFRDYGPVRIAPGDFYGDAQRAMAFEVQRQLAKIGRPLVRGEWYLTPPTVNANYDPQMNEINFPAGQLMPPAFDPRLDDAPNYGNTGGTIGHELTHGFDDEGRKFDARGNLRDFWTEADGKEFERRAACVSEQYSQYVVVDEVKINGQLTLGEDLADLGGLILAYRAWEAQTAGQRLAPIDDLTPQQRFFVGYAQSWCGTTRPETARLRALTDPHSPGRYRTNGVVANMPEFAEAFGCKPGAPLRKEPVCKVW